MAKTLHRAITDAIRDARRYDELGVLPTLVLEATTPLDADESLLYQAVYTLFLAMPERLLPGSVLRILTEDVDGGVQLSWSAKERMDAVPDAEPAGLRGALSLGPHGDLVEIALLALERFCRVRAGAVETRRERVLASSSFGYPAHVARHVTALIPGRPPGDAAAAAMARLLPSPAPTARV